jgi:hypothetical protein
MVFEALSPWNKAQWRIRIHRRLTPRNEIIRFLYFSVESNLGSQRSPIFAVNLDVSRMSS